MKSPMIQPNNRPVCSAMTNSTKSTPTEKTSNDHPQNRPTANKQVKVVGNVMQLTKCGGQLITIDGKQFYRQNSSLRPIRPATNATRVLNVSSPSGQASSVISSTRFPPHVPPPSMLLGQNVQKLKRRRMNSDSTDSSDSDEDGATLLKANIVDGPKRTTRKENKLKEQIEREERTYHTCFYDDLLEDFTVSPGLPDKCPICKHKNKLRKVRVAMPIANELKVDKSQIADGQLFVKTNKLLHKTKKFKVNVPKLSMSHLANLRLMNAPNVMLEATREKDVKKNRVKMFESEEPGTFNKREHPHVDQLTCYKRNPKTIISNRRCIHDIRKNKEENRTQMMIEKSMGLYDASEMAKTDIDVCHMCKAGTTQETKCPTFCDFCFGIFKEFHFSSIAVEERKMDRRKNIEYRMKHISAENRKRKRRAKGERSSSRCPHLELRTFARDDDEEDEEEEINNDEDEEEGASTADNSTKETVNEPPEAETSDEQ